MSDYTNRRSDERFSMQDSHHHHHLFAEVEEKSLLAHSHVQEVELLNISASGSQIRTQEHIDEHHLLTLSLFINGKVFKFSANVVRKISEKCYALHFNNHVEEIERYFAECELLPHFGDNAPKASLGIIKP